MARLSCRRVDRRAAYKVRTHCALAAPCLESKASRSLSDRFVLIASPQGHSNWSWASSIPHASDFSSPSHSEGQHAPARWAVDLEISLGTFLLTTPSLPRQAIHHPLGLSPASRFVFSTTSAGKSRKSFQSNFVHTLVLLIITPEGELGELSKRCCGQGQPPTRLPATT